MDAIFVMTSNLAQRESADRRLFFSSRNGRRS